MKEHPIFRTVWWGTNVLLAAAIISLIFACGWEYSVRRYLKGFSDAIVPEAAAPEQKVEAILEWMRHGPSRNSSAHSDELAARDPQNTLNYRELLDVCGTATNAFLNLRRSGGLQVRRLLLLGPNRAAKHVVAEVLIGDRWIIVDPMFRTMLRDPQGRLLTRQQLRAPGVLEQATRDLPDYPLNYNYNSVAHIRLARIPLMGLGLRRVLDWMYAGWDEAFDWSLILERESFAMLFASFLATVFLSIGRLALAWHADRRLHIPRSRLRARFLRARAALFSSPGLK